MCLSTKTSVCSVAANGIKCYKILLCCDGEFMTPYQKAFVPIKVIECNIPFFADGVKRVEEPYFSDGKYIIGGGFIHTYKYFGSASDFRKHLKKMYPNLVYAIFECEIPIGTKYYEGQDDFFETSFASEKIIFKKQLV